MREENIFDDFRKVAANIEKIIVTEKDLSLIYVNGQKEIHSFDTLKKVTIITTDDGPFEDDVYWLMLFENIIMIPQGCPGEDTLLPRLQKLSGFDNQVFIEAMTCSENQAFQIWEKTGRI